MITTNAAVQATTPSQDMSGGRFIAETLKGYGVTHVFFMESVLRQTLIEMEDLGIRRVLAHSEAGAAYMADGYARIARRLGVCLAQSVGAANLAAAMQDPFLGGSPVLALTGKKLSSFQYRNAYQEVPHAPMFGAVTKFDATVETAEQLPRLLRQALRETTSGAPGPAHLDIAGGFAGEAIENARADYDVIVEDAFTKFPAFRHEPERSRLNEAAKLLMTAQRPIIVAGGGARSSSASEPLLALAEKLNAPVATTLNAKGIIPETHPLSVGVVGTYSRRPANRAVYEADLVLFVGSHTSDQATNNWTIPARGTKIVQIDIDPREIGRSYPVAAALVGDARASIERLIELVDERPAQSEWTERCRELNEEWQADYEALCESDAQPVKPERICREITRELPENGILVSDTGYSGIWSGALMEITKPGQEYIRAAGSLGWGFPASLGAKCAAPGRPVICFTGDGGFWYHISELETALRCGINTVTVINNNSSFGQCIDAIRRNYGNRSGKPGEMHDFTKTNFAAIAESIGCLGIRVEDPAEIAPAIRAALASGRPAVVDIVTDPDARAPAPWNPPAK